MEGRVLQILADESPKGKVFGAHMCI